jgi:hypothetical protein
VTKNAVSNAPDTIKGRAQVSNAQADIVLAPLGIGPPNPRRKIDHAINQSRLREQDFPI